MQKTVAACTDSHRTAHHCDGASNQARHLHVSLRVTASFATTGEHSRSARSPGLSALHPHATRVRNRVPAALQAHLQFASRMMDPPGCTPQSGHRSNSSVAYSLRPSMFQGLIQESQRIHREIEANLIKLRHAGDASPPNRSLEHVQGSATFRARGGNTAVACELVLVWRFLFAIQLR